MKTNRFSPMVWCAAAALFCGTHAPAQIESPGRIPTITAQGQAEVAVRPDLAVVRLGAVAQAADASDAQRRVNDIVRKAVDAFKELDIPEGRIRTVGLSLQPVYSRERPGPQPQPTEPAIIGYRASNTVQVEVVNLERVGEVIDAGVAAGANRIESLSFGLRDDREAKDRALALAAERAHEKARVMARALNVPLRDLYEVVEQTPDFIRPMEMHRTMALDAATPVMPGELRVEASVTVRYRLP